ncbi:beta-ketoacyl-[acyl-carrier-protein] synthase family protein [Solihabitans fulvus]|uniref:Beta-ketoacyl-[acyl-carrier-protein] synthase family protein n=1 Tax=Solihabitans fulvus TaxID=1892852 RepID=A0A5B2XHU2_9PSEU|nr:beta-ketoacyl-[acyl-carrier-protein] synthase family protein [Solihabitans fulvus]KAA2262625.1 beta-ketoacyl-[acyl-carrier-protein] synthase family protein [Solihabitans fulvus]
MTRVAITGVGAVTPLGNDARSTWQGLVAGRSGISALRTFDASTFPVRIAAQVTGFDAAGTLGRAARRLSRAAGFAVAAADEAIGDAGIGWNAGSEWTRGVCLAGTVGRVELPDLVELADDVLAARYPRQHPAGVALRDQTYASAFIARRHGFGGPVVNLSTACAGAANAIGEAVRMIRGGECELVLAGGYDSLTSWLDVLGFSLLGALAHGWEDVPSAASRPFSVDRNGFVLGEGAVVLVMEDLARAVARGATVHAELAGYGSTLNAYRITDSPPDGGGATEAMRQAIADAGAVPEQVDYVVAHGTGTPGNDASETAAIKRVFGAHADALCVSSPKSMTGHLTAAAAGVNVIAALGALRDQVVPPTMNLHRQDPLLDLDFVPLRARDRAVDTVLANAFAFGGTNASMLLRAAPEGRHDA